MIQSIIGLIGKTVTQEYILFISVLVSPGFFLSHDISFSPGFSRGYTALNRDLRQPSAVVFYSWV